MAGKTKDDNVERVYKLLLANRGITVDRISYRSVHCIISERLQLLENFQWAEWEHDLAPCNFHVLDPTNEVLAKWRLHTDEEEEEEEEEEV